MDLLLDTHMAYWYMLGDERVTKLARSLIEDKSNRVFVSLVSAWEIGLKHQKHPSSMPMDSEEFVNGCRESEFVVLPVTEDQILASQRVAPPAGLPHQDPFDRFLLGAAETMGMRFLTHDAKIGLYDAPFIMFI